MNNLFNFLFNKIISIKKKLLINIIKKKTKNKVLEGIYRSAYFSPQNSWSTSDYPSKMLGTYEEEIQKKIIALKKKYHLKYLVNFGSADGYHILGLLKNKFFEKGLAFEINKKGRDIILKNSILNNIKKKIKIFSEANLNIVFKELNNTDLKKTLFLIDIEGDEYNLFNKNHLKKINKSFLIIEDHPFLEKNQKKKEIFYKLLNANYTIEKLKTTNRNPFKFNFLSKLSDHEKWLLMSEGRPQTMYWIICKPKL